MNTPIHAKTLLSPPQITDELAASRAPHAIGDDGRHTMQTVLDAIDVLDAAAPLDGTERVAVFQGASAKKSTIAGITIIKSVPDKLFLAQNYF